MTKKRNIFVAGLFNLVSPGLGFLYVGKPYYAILFPVSLLLLLGVSAWTNIIFTPAGYSGTLIFLIGFWFLGVILASLIAYKIGFSPLCKYQKWYVYILFVVLAYLVNNTVLANRGGIFAYDFFRLPANSMANTLVTGDFIISNTWKFKEVRPKRGDIIIFQYPKDPSIKYVKRVIGLPNDLVRINNGKVYVNGEELVEPYVDSSKNQRLSYRIPGEYKVPESFYFVLGDNRDNSNDSRFWGYVPEEYIYGSAEFIWISYDPKNGLRDERAYQTIN